MSNISVSRQPILNAEQIVEGYELVYPPSDVDETVATARVAINALSEIGLEQLVGRARAWISVTPGFLHRDLARTLPADRVVLQIAAAVAATPAMLETIAELRAAGYRVAADRFCYSPELEPLLEAVELIKLDMRALGPRELAHHTARLRPYELTLIAANIDSGDAFKLAQAAGANLFQGFFFCRPHMLAGRRITPSRTALLRLSTTLQDPAIELADLERVISADVALSYRLLKYINSAYFGLRSQVSSIKQAIALLGLEPLRRWATLTILGEVGDAPRELFVTALIRARFCELAGDAIDGLPAELFTLGLFSVLDALTGTPMRTALHDLPLTPALRDALIDHAGAGRLLDSVIAIEAGQFDYAEEIVPAGGDHYVEAVSWSNEAAGHLLAA
jgi:c-di-GMP phosphodiesterase